MRKILYVIAIALLSVMTYSCGNNTKNQAVAAETRSEKDTIPYIVAHNYFVRNDVDSVPVLITDSITFSRYFGEAPVMGKDGEPTTIDFSKQYVIAVVLPETNRETTISDGVLLHEEADNYIFTYNVIQGEENSYSTRPFLLAVVSRREYGTLRIIRRVRKYSAPILLAH